LSLETDRFDEYETQTIHADPEFPELPYGEHYTYGDRHEQKIQSLKKLDSSDYVFFFGTLDYVGQPHPEYWINPDWGAYVFGHFELARDPIVGKEELEKSSDFVRERVSNNAHMRRAELDGDIILLISDPGGSKLYKKPVPLSKPGGSLHHLSKFNDIVESRGTDQRGTWYRGPLEFDSNITKRILDVSNTHQFHEALYSEVERLPGFSGYISELYRPSTFDEIRSIFSDCETEEEELFASFSYIAAGWTTRIPEAVLGTISRPIERPQQVVEESGIVDTLITTFEELNESDNWPHSHRWYYPISAGHYRDKAEGESLETGMANLYLEILDSFPYESFEEFLDPLRHAENGFAEGFQELRNPIESFGRTPAFDWMETLVTAHGYGQLAPQTLKWDYVRGDNSKPKQGLKQVYSIDSIEELDDDDDARKNGMLSRLMKHARREKGMGTAGAVFAVESALCMCQKGNSEVSPEDTTRTSPGSPPC